MKMNMTLMGIAGLVLLSLTSTGCMITKAVTDIGKRTEMLNEVPDARPVVVAEDGAIALKVRSKVVADHSLVCECDKYFLASRPVVERDIKKTYQWQGIICAPPNRRFPQTIERCVVRVSPKYRDEWWDVVPNGLSNENMTLEKLPLNFKKNASTYGLRQPFPYAIMDKNIRLEVDREVVMRREHRVWWGYPAQVLVPPAFMIDLMCCPFWLATIGENNEFIHYEPPWKAF